MGGLSPVLYRPVVPARHAENGQNLGVYQNLGVSLGVRLKFTDFLPNYSSLYLCSQASYQNTQKTQILTITVQYQFSYS
jgi:hypothetical protein